MASDDATPRDLSTNYVWFDTEYTTLDLGSAHILQASLVVTDSGLERLGQDLNLILHIDRSVPVQPWVQQNAAPLLSRCYESSISVEAADKLLSERIDATLGPSPEDPGSRAVLAGNSIHCDWVLVRRLLPQMSRRLNYRLLDVSALKMQWRHHWGHEREELNKDDPEALKQFFPGAEIDPEQGRHDAYYDTQASIAELAFYRRKLRRS